MVVHHIRGRVNQIELDRKHERERERERERESKWIFSLVPDEVVWWWLEELEVELMELGFSLS